MATPTVQFQPSLSKQVTRTKHQPHASGSINMSLSLVNEWFGHHAANRPTSARGTPIKQSTPVKPNSLNPLAKSTTIQGIPKPAPPSALQKPNSLNPLAKDDAWVQVFVPAPPRVDNAPNRPPLLPPIVQTSAKATQSKIDVYEKKGLPATVETISVKKEETRHDDIILLDGFDLRYSSNDDVLDVVVVPFSAHFRSSAKDVVVITASVRDDGVSVLAQMRCGFRPSFTRHDVIQILGERLQSVFLGNPFACAKNNGKTHSSTATFQGMGNPPSISIRDYVKRIGKYADASGEAMILAIIYIDRIQQWATSFPINDLTIHRLVLVAIMVASKFFDDEFVDNSTYAKIGGVPLKEINLLEVDFLDLIGFSLYVSSTDYSQAFRKYFFPIK